MKKKPSNSNMIKKFSLAPRKTRFLESEGTNSSLKGCAKKNFKKLQKTKKTKKYCKRLNKTRKK